jgi:DNA-binding MarR family transcriptional regulator
MSRLVRGLERDDLAARHANAEDARSVVVSATPKGRRLLEEGRERRIAELATRLASLSAEEIEALGRAAALVEQALRLSPSAAST